MSIGERVMQKPVGIFGGAFDPVHFGHLRTALEITGKFLLEKLYFVPCQTPVHKLPPLAAAHHRIAMLKLAVTGESRFCVDNREIERKTPSYMIETLQSFREELGAQKPLALILGSDAFTEFTSWREWEKIFDLAHIIVVSRGDQETKLSSDLEHYLSERRNENPESILRVPAGKVFFQKVISLAISSTFLRSQIAQKNSPRYLIPDQVWEYIRKEQLYMPLRKSVSERYSSRE